MRHSAVRRTADGNLSIHVQLYQAVAQWTDGEQFYPLSVDGKIVNRPTTTRSPNTIVFRGNVPNDISGIIDASNIIANNLDYLEFIENRRWNLHTVDGTTIMLPEKNPESAVASLMVLNQNHNILSRDIDIIDMRDDARILIK